jgi:hypothetical protein
MRILVFYIIVAAIAIYAFRDWFVSLCGLIVLAGLAENMPKNVMGIQGLNAWNALLAVVLLAWFLSRTSEGRRWDLPRRAWGILVFYVLVVIVSVIRMLADIGSFPPSLNYTFGGMASTYFVNSLKWMLPGLLLYDGVRTRQRLFLGSLAVLGPAVIYALLMMRQSTDWISGGEGWEWRRFQAGEQVGLHPNDAAFVMAWGAWAGLCLVLVFRKISFKVAGSIAVVLMLVGIVRCGSRGAMVTLPAVGLLLGVVRSRAILGATIGVIVAGTAVGAVTQRLGHGRSEDPLMTVEAAEDAKWSGRVTQIWPAALARAAESPLVGHGRLGMYRGSGGRESIQRFGALWGHAHCAYLEMLVDAGIIGLASALAVFVPMLVLSIRHARHRSDPFLATVGAMGVAALGTYLVMGLASQTLFPVLNTVGLWAMMGLVLRVHVSCSEQGQQLEYVQSSL